MYLKKIETDEWIDYISRRFEETGKYIPVPAAAHLVELVQNHSYYVQQLAQISWFRTTEHDCSIEIVDQSFDILVNQLEMLFTITMEDLTPTQVDQSCIG